MNTLKASGPYTGPDDDPQATKKLFDALQEAGSSDMSATMHKRNISGRVAAMGRDNSVTPDDAHPLLSVFDQFPMKIRTIEFGSAPTPGFWHATANMGQGVEVPSETDLALVAEIIILQTQTSLEWIRVVLEPDALRPAKGLLSVSARSYGTEKNLVGMYSKEIAAMLAEALLSSFIFVNEKAFAVGVKQTPPRRNPLPPPPPHEDA